MIRGPRISRDILSEYNPGRGLFICPVLSYNKYVMMPLLWSSVVTMAARTKRLFLRLRVSLETSRSVSYCRRTLWLQGDVGLSLALTYFSTPCSKDPRGHKNKKNYSRICWMARGPAGQRWDYIVQKYRVEALYRDRNALEQVWILSLWQLRCVIM